MKKLELLIKLLFTLFFLIIFDSCSETTTTKELKGYWKHTSTEIWWIAPDNDTNQRQQISAIPFNTEFIQVDDNRVIYKGFEYNITRYEYNPSNNDELDSITYIWDNLPSKMDIDKEYSINYESIGIKPGIGNGIGMKYPSSDYFSNKWGPFSFRDGEKTIKIKMSSPVKPNGETITMICVSLSSGRWYYIEYYYIYKWIE